MNYTSLADFLARGRAVLARGPVALILVEDLIEVESTLRHHLDLGFRAVLVLAPRELELPEDLAARIHRIAFDQRGPQALAQAVNPVIEACAPGVWFYYCYNAEYLFFPFCEHRTIGEMLAFHTEERREAMLTYAVDLYAEDLGTHPSGVDRASAMLDRAGYFALVRKDADGRHLDRQYDFFGGLRWRFEEHIPPQRRKIDRISILRTRKGLRLAPDYTLNDPEMNTYACPWHHNLTAAVMSFRVAKALKLNPGSTFDIPNFRWYNSVRFEWSSQQLMDLGLMEPGQWF
ncbi:hypothetical protein [Phaeovulum vinaykumarii]|uniref:Glycosyl transferase family 2 n=1 Tax=Phaeovulum vinaykumarii TaxID=407234 RepID=A0A1N7M2N0_9RHOB|nr:hypothetical protein [Phaeovulum vinaykumarii]SIS80239.1 hypothetical protein SAMN05421795_10595 [Phaeovulum vinaykumarii]SOC09330.1 hypothetical protein SAMN05878426_105107 [Phaeovulum vinaykumarii]